MGEERILRGELIYTFNYLGSTPLLGDAFRFSMRALGAAALASPSQGCCSTAGIDLGLGACHCSSERCWCFFLSPSVTMSAMLGPCPVNLQPAVVSRILSTKEGNSAVWEGGSWWREVGACEAAGSKILPDRRKLGGGNNYGTFSTLPKPYVWSYLCIF